MARNDVVTRFTAEVDDASFKQAEKKLTSSQRRAAQAEQADIAFSRASKDVALAGDVESNLRTFGGAIGAVGGEAGQAAEKVIALGAEFPAVVEAAGRLPQALKGFPAAIGNAVESIGGMKNAIGVGVGAGALVGALWLAKEAFDSVRNSAEKFAEEQGRIAEEAIATSAIQLMSTSDLLALQKESTENIIEQTAAVDALNAADNLLLDDLARVESGRFAFAAAAAAEASGLKEVNDSLETSESNLKSVNAELEKRNDLESGAVERSREIGDLRRLENEAIDRSTEANQKRLDALSREERILNEQIAALTGDTSEAATKELAKLESQLARVGQETDIVTSAMSRAGASMEEVSKEAEKAAKAQAASNKKIGDLQQKIADETRKIAQDEIEARRAAAMKITEFQAGNLQKRGQILKDFNRSVIEAELQAGRARRKQKAHQDFEALFEGEQTQGEEADARKRDRDQKLADLQESIKVERKKLLEETRVKAKSGNNQLRNLHRQLNAELQAKAQAAKALVDIEIQKGKALVDINKQIADNFTMLFRRAVNQTQTTNNNQSLTVNGQVLPLSQLQAAGVEQSVINVLEGLGIR